jgi:dTDP-4-amino-4,6-dideoxygalactose transaminase
MKPARIYLSPPHLNGHEIELVQEVFASNYIAPVGPMVEAFEREFAGYVGLAHAVALSSGTAAMHLALREVMRGGTEGGGWRVGSRGQGTGDGEQRPLVLASTLTFIGGVSPAVFEGCELRFIDSDRATWNMDPALLAEELASCAKQGRLPKVVIPTDAYGQCCDQDALRRICQPFGIPLIEDAAEAVGSSYKGRPAGAGADLAVYSFNGNKLLTTGGGGMLASDNLQAIEHARFLSMQARDPAPHYEHSEIGYNYRLSNILAAIGRGQLRVVETCVEKRRWVFNRYVERLDGLPGIAFMPEASYGRCNRWLTVILVNEGDFGASPEQIRLALEAEDIEARPVWKPMHLQPVFAGSRIRSAAFGLESGSDAVARLGIRGAERSVSEDLFHRGLCLPSGTAMTAGDIDRVCAVVKRAGRNR